MGQQSKIVSHQSMIVGTCRTANKATTATTIRTGSISILIGIIGTSILLLNLATTIIASQQQEKHQQQHQNQTDKNSNGKGKDDNANDTTRYAIIKMVRRRPFPHHGRRLSVESTRPHELAGESTA